MADVLVTGAGGFIGSHLLAALGRDDRVVAIDRAAGDIAAAETWKALPDTEIVVHLAARNFVPESWTDPAGYMRTNLQGTMQALDYCRERKARLVFLSSYLYGAPKTLPVDETAPLHTPNPYALSKRLAEEACRFYAENFAVPVTVLRPFNVFGPGQRPEFLIPKIAAQVAAKREIVVEDLEPRRDYLYIDDLVALIVTAIRRPSPFEVVNAGSGESHAVSDVIEAVMAAGGERLPVRSEERRRPNEIMDVRADITKAHRLFGWRPAWTLARGCAAVLAAARVPERPS